MTALVTKGMRHAVRHMAPGIALAATTMVSGSAWAVTANACRNELHQLDAAIPAGVQGAWAESIQDDLNTLNAMGDAASVRAWREKIWAEFDAYQENPDPDGDGLAIAPQVAQAHMVLRTCLSVARIAELEAAAEEAVEAEQPEAPANEEPEAAEDRSAPPKPVGNPGQWFAAASYPVVALREGRGGVVRYDITVGADGAVAGCQASGPPGNADLELATCEAVMAHARFTPATDKAGRPVPGEISGSIRWTIPE